MKKYLLRNTIIDLLLRIELDNGYSHLLINHEIKAKNIPTKDEGLLTEIVYGTIQRKLTLDYYISHFVNPKKKLEPWVKILLRMSIYQMVFLDKVPDHAIIHEAVEIAKQRGHKGIGSFVNAILRNIQRNGTPDINEISDDIERLSIETSHPKWLVKRWINEYGFQRTREMCEANLQHKPMSVRIQPLKITRDEAIQQLEKEGYVVNKSFFSKQGLIIEKGNILKSSLFEQGVITIQDQSSMLVGEMIDARPGCTVLDACSAPGGKATHIAEKMKNEGHIHAHDLHQKKIKLINEKAKGLNITIIDAVPMDARKLDEHYSEEMFDRILIDAPCSGLGVMRGKPDIKYSKKEEDIERLSIIQQEILSTVVPLLKIDGLLVYSTCTVDTAENEEVVKQFLAKHTNYEIDQTFFSDLPKELQSTIGITAYGLQLFPQEFETDGFFLTRFRRVS
ncbi:16S rRNA (cytosine(967)-C(5))-methyltransferase RsmB [Ornithinibacillus halotolerans]|uniref:16S rRNA (cytosine(967)-C(5))-methyltransferase n=1 Tax=Ornithinibacillus halotolerans TaxID=1274357 RepID=A0A916S4U1_9BACI|nr:16S rRNA (cytosine(967)-C(5))-methyltransferase RsmB [Ornithinibacillus halotolerans]GGA84190.1 ribosomal RNA small subunit methyltransferase B [Ornithinibacillus halotolerans]